MIGAFGAEDRPRLAAHARLIFDRVRQRWVVMSPERMFVPNETALTVLQRCSGERTLADIVGDLAREFDADPAQIEADVRLMLAELVEKGLVRR